MLQLQSVENTIAFELMTEQVSLAMMYNNQMSEALNYFLSIYFEVVIIPLINIKNKKNFAVFRQISLKCQFGILSFSFFSVPLLHDPLPPCLFQTCQHLLWVSCSLDRLMGNHCGQQSCCLCLEGEAGASLWKQLTYLT